MRIIVKTGNGFRIEGMLDGLNDYTRACRSGWQAGSRMKQKNENIVMESIMASDMKKVTEYPVGLRISWHDSSKRDWDNVAFAIKFIQDAMVRKGILENDSQKYISSIHYDFCHVRSAPYIEVEVVPAETEEAKQDR